MEGKESAGDGADRRSHVPPAHFLLARLEEAKCCDRLGDLYRLTDSLEESSRRYDEGDFILRQLDQVMSIQAVDVELRDDVELQKINTAIGRRLLDASSISVGAAAPLRSDDEYEKHVAWLLSKLPTDPTHSSLAENSLADTRTEAATSLVRYLLVGQEPGVSGGDNTAEGQRLTQAVQWASWLVAVRGETRDKNLCEAAQRQLAKHYEASRDMPLAQSSWMHLVENLKTWNQSTAVRPDRLQSLAHAQMKSAQHLAAQGRLDDAASLYRAAIDDLNVAWQLLDTDAFHQTSLAEAQYNLGELSANSLEHAAEARQLLARSIAFPTALVEVWFLYSPSGPTGGPDAVAAGEGQSAPLLASGSTLPEGE